MLPRWLAILAAVTCGSCATHEPDALVIVNASSRALAELRLSPVAEDVSGPSLIPPLAPGDQASVAAIACQRYDVVVVDQKGARCTLGFQHLCFAKGESWSIDDVTLADCR
jgi:hypothetical protein